MFPEYRYIPNPDKRKSRTALFLCAVPTLVFAVLHVTEVFTPYCDYLALIFGAGLIYFIVRYEIMTFRYVLTADGYLRAEKIEGKRELTVANLPLSECDGISLCERKNFPRGAFSALSSFCPEKAIVVRFPDSGQEKMLLLDYDRDFWEELEKRQAEIR